MCFFTPQIDKHLEKVYFDMFGDKNFGMPHLPSEVSGNVAFYEAAVLKCIENKKPMSFYLRDYFPELYDAYKKLESDLECYL